MPQNLSPSTQDKIITLRSKYPDITQFTATFHPERIGEFATHPARCVTGTAPTLTDLKLSYPGAAHLQWLIAQLATFQEYSSVPNKMSKPEVETCAQNIYAEFHYLKTTEAMLFLAHLLGGKYPVDFHGYITPQKILAALREHFIPWRNHTLREHELKQQQQREAEENKHNPPMTYAEWQEIKTIIAMYNPNYTIQ